MNNEQDPLSCYKGVDLLVFLCVEGFILTSLWVAVMVVRDFVVWMRA